MSTLKGKNWLPLEQILSIKSRYHLGKTLCARYANRKLRKVSPFETMAEKDGGVPILLKISNFLVLFTGSDQK